jgi:hypothetical protein
VVFFLAGVKALRERAFIVLVSLLFFAAAGCGFADASWGPEESEMPRDTEIEADPLRAGTHGGRPDAEGLIRILEHASELQAESAGSSLRAAALGGSLLCWLEENPQAGAAALPEVRRWALQLNCGERARIGRSLQLLRNAAVRMKEKELEDLLRDAGYEIGFSAADREVFIGFADGLVRVMMQEIFKNSAERMNISS